MQLFETMHDDCVFFVTAQDPNLADLNSQILSPHRYFYVNQDYFQRNIL